MNSQIDRIFESCEYDAIYHAASMKVGLHIVQPTRCPISEFHEHGPTLDPKSQPISFRGDSFLVLGSVEDDPRPQELPIRRMTRPHPSTKASRNSSQAEGGRGAYLPQCHYIQLNTGIICSYSISQCKFLFKDYVLHFSLFSFCIYTIYISVCTCV